MDCKGNRRWIAAFLNIAALAGVAGASPRIGFDIREKGSSAGTGFWAEAPGTSDRPPAFAADSSPQADAPIPVIRSRVNLVQVPVRVTRRGQAVKGLREDDFTLLEDGKPQKIRHFDAGDAPFSLALILDVSGSMKPRFETVIAAAHHFIDQLRPGDETVIVAFSNRAEVAQRFTNDKNALHKKLGSLEPGGGTALYDTLYQVGMKELDRKDGAKKAIVVLTDGDDNESGRPLEMVADYLQTQGILAYTIDLNDKPNKGLKTIAQATGASYFKATDAADLAGIYGQVAQELRDIYMLGYYPQGADRWHWRQINVAVNRAGLRNAKVEARRGYCPGEQCRSLLDAVPRNAHEAAQIMAGYYLDATPGPSEVILEKPVALSAERSTLFFQKGAKETGEGLDYKEPFCVVGRSPKDVDDRAKVAAEAGSSFQVGNPKVDVRNPAPSVLGQEYWAAAVEVGLSALKGDQELRAVCYWPWQIPGDSAYRDAFEMLSPLLKPASGIP